MVTPVTVIGVGIDLVDLERVRSLLASKGEQAMTRFFSERERGYLATRTDATGHAAARIAAKEAVYKAMQTLPEPGPSAGGRSRCPATRKAGRQYELHGLAARVSRDIGGLRIQSLPHPLGHLGRRDRSRRSALAATSFNSDQYYSSLTVSAPQTG